MKYKVCGAWGGSSDGDPRAPQCQWTAASGLPQTGRKTTRRNAVLIDDMAGTVQRWYGRVDFRCTARFVSLTGHRVAIFVSGSILGWR